MVTGDAVNTASRLQGAAPVGGILVGDATLPRDAPARSSTRSWSRSRSRARPSRCRCGAPSTHVPGSGWTSTRAHQRRSSAADASWSCFAAALHRCVAESAIQLVTLVRRAGRRQDAGCERASEARGRRPRRLVLWRQGRCLPYGEGITYWPLGETVKAQAGIRESDDLAGDREAPSSPRGRLEDLPDRRLVRAPASRQPPRVCLRTGAAAARNRSPPGARFFEELAARSPLVLIVEDLHWADDAMLDVRGASRRVGDRCADPRHLHRPARALRAASRLGRRQAQRHHPCRFPACPTRTRRGWWRRCSTAGGAAGRDSRRCCSSARAATRCSPRSSCACSLDRGAGRRGRPCRWPPTPHPPAGDVQALIAARLDTLRRPQGRCSTTRPSSARSSGPAPSPPMGASIEAARPRRLARAGPARADPAAPVVECRGRRPSTCSGTRWCATSPTARSLVPRGSRSTKRRRRGCARRPGIEPRMSPSCWRITTSKPSRWRRPLASTRWSAGSGPVRSKRSRWRAPAPCRSTPGRPTSSTVVRWSCRCRVA